MTFHILESPPRRRRPRRGATVLDSLLILASAVLLAGGTGMLVNSAVRAKAATAPPSIEDARGKLLATIESRDDTGVTRAIPMTGKARVIYVFSTTCHFCEEQRERIGIALAQLDTGSVVTVSQEPLSRIRNYWSAIGKRLPTPISTNGDSLRQLGIAGTPAMVFLQPDGRVHSAYLGASVDWTADRLRRELDGLQR